MSIKFTCQHCNQVLEAEDSMQGETLECPNCSNSITVISQVKKNKNTLPTQNVKTSGINKALIGIIVGLIILFSSYIVYNESGSLKKAVSKLAINSDSPEGVLRAYITAENWKNRLPFILNPQITEPLMEKRYGDDGFDNKFEKTKVLKEIDANQYMLLKVYWSYLNNKKRKQTSDTYYLKNTSEGYKIDWQASIGINPMTWKAFKAQRVTTPMNFRVNARLADYYNYEFLMKKESYYSICFSDSGLYGFVYKNSPLGKKIFNILKDGEWHKIILKINFSPVHRKSSRIVYIQDLVSDTWINE